ncbi:MAG: phage antirepressor N-terminal domain-containing protein [Pseudomonadota bacterium]
MGNIVTVDFRGDQLCAFERDDGVFVALRPIVEAMGLNWSGQLQRLRRDTILSEGVCIMHTPLVLGGDQEAVCLKLELVNGWLLTIDDSRIKDDEIRERVLTYKRECYKVLFDHFYKGARRPEEIDVEPDDARKAPVGERLKQVTEARHTFSTGAAREMWFKLGLPVTPSMLKADPQPDFFEPDKVIDHQAA